MPASTVHTIFGGEIAITEVMAEESKKVPEKKSRHLALPLLVLVAILGAALGTGLWIRSRHRSVGEPHPQTAAQEVQAVMHLESFTVNLTDKDSSGFLRIGIDLGLAHEISGGKEGEQAARFTPLLRDTLLTELSAWDSQDLLAVDGKAKLKAQLLKALQDRAPEIDVKEIYFNDFLVQR